MENGMNGLQSNNKVCFFPNKGISMFQIQKEVCSGIQNGCQNMILGKNDGLL